MSRGIKKYTKIVETRFEPKDYDLIEQISEVKDLKKGQLIRQYTKKGIAEDMRDGVI